MDRQGIGLAFITSLPGYGGGEKWFLETAREMSARGHRVLVVGQPGGDVVRRAQRSGLRTAGVSMHGILDVRTLWRMARLLRREGIQLAFTNQAREIRLVGLSQLGRRDFHQIARRGSPDPVKNVWHFRWVYTHWVDRLIVNCRALLPRIFGHAPWFDLDSVRVIHNGIDIDSFAAGASARRAAESLGIDDDVLVVSMIGEIGWRKDQATFLEAVAAWRKRERPPVGRPVVFLIVGDGKARGELQARASDLGLEAAQVRWLGFRRDVPDLLLRSDVLVLPTREEGFPNTLLEGMALGVPVVATPVDGIPELVVDRDTGLIVPTEDPASLARAIGELLADEALRRELGEAGRARVKDRFTQRRMMDQVEQLILETVAGDDRINGKAP